MDEQKYMVCWISRDGRFMCLKNSTVESEDSSMFSFIQATSLAETFGYSVVESEMAMAIAAKFKE